MRSPCARLVTVPAPGDRGDPAWEDLSPACQGAASGLPLGPLRFARIGGLDVSTAIQLTELLREHGTPAWRFTDRIRGEVEPELHAVAAPLDHVGLVPAVAALAELGRASAAAGEALDRLLTNLVTIPAGWGLRHRRLEFGDQPVIMGIVNTTPDSFSDGGLHLEADQAVARAAAMVEQGADIIDIGGESTRPGADPVSTEEEIRRVVPVIERVTMELEVPVSIDTSKSEVARAALDAGAEIVNDVTALDADPTLAEVTAGRGAHLVLMHSRGTPRTMQKDPFYASLWGELLGELGQRLELAVEAGVPRERIMLDPGIGFGKRVIDNYRILREIEVMKGMGLPILIGASRKSFIGAVAEGPPSSRVSGSVAAAVAAVLGGAHAVRVHDVAETSQALQVAAALRRPETLCSP